MAQNKEKISHFWKWLEDKILDDYPSWTAFESAIGFSRGAMGRRRNQLKYPTAEMAMAICDKLGISWNELWSEAGITKTLNTNELDGSNADIARELIDVDDIQFKDILLRLIRHHKANKR